jgi:CBS domain-containing protein
MSRSILVKDYMILQPPKVQSSTPIAEVIDTLIKNNVSGVPVVDEVDTIIGYVSEQDCIHQVLVDSYHCELTTVVNDVMREDVVTVSPKDSIIDLANRMQDNKPKHFPVVLGGKLVGLIRRSDVLRALATELKDCR